jgi:hypothetical protein
MTASRYVRTARRADFGAQSRVRTGDPARLTPQPRGQFGNAVDKDCVVYVAGAGHALQQPRYAIDELIPLVLIELPEVEFFDAHRSRNRFRHAEPQAEKTTPKPPKLLPKSFGRTLYDQSVNRRAFHAGSR